jgi:plasmid maintenance system antidote protein VapI
MSKPRRYPSLVELIARTDLSQGGLAKAIGLKRPSTISDWVTGKTVPKLYPSQYQKLLELFDCDPDELTQAFEMAKAKAMKGLGETRKKPRPPTIELDRAIA